MAPGRRATAGPASPEPVVLQRLTITVPKVASHLRKARKSAINARESAVTPPVWAGLVLFSAARAQISTGKDCRSSGSASRKRDILRQPAAIPRHSCPMAGLRKASFFLSLTRTRRSSTLEATLLGAASKLHMVLPKHLARMGNTGSRAEDETAGRSSSAESAGMSQTFRTDATERAREKEPVLEVERERRERR